MAVPRPRKSTLSVLLLMMALSSQKQQDCSESNPSSAFSSPQYRLAAAAIPPPSLPTAQFPSPTFSNNQIITRRITALSMADPAQQLPHSLDRDHLMFPSLLTAIACESSPLAPDNFNSTASNSSRCLQQDDASAVKASGQLEASLMEKECSMCGDTGIFEDLFRCTRCRHRYQHIYCSRSYPNLGSERWVCNWCLHEDDKIQQDKEVKQIVKRKAEEIGDGGKVQQDKELKHSLKKKAEEIGDGSHNASPSSPVNKNSEAKTDEVVNTCKESDIASGIQVPKRQRCNHAVEKSNINTLGSRWRHLGKNRLQLNPSRGIAGRRYKLLADVLC